MTSVPRRSPVFALAVSGWVVGAAALWGIAGGAAVAALLLAAAPLALRRRSSPDVAVHDRRRDPLAALPNRSLLLERLALALNQPDRRGPVAVACLDIDRFRRVNEGAGHVEGDRLLAAVAGRLVGALHPGDTLATLGGDEFAVLCEEPGDDDGVRRLAGRVASALAAPFEVNGSSMSINCTVGIATGERPDDAETLLRNAAVALSRGKERGRGGFVVYDRAMHERVQGRLAIEQELTRAVERGELVVHYQPIVSLREGRISAVEALMRWAHPERGLLPPQEFVPVAEETGLIVPLGAWALEQACAQAAWWRRRHPGFSALSVAVNLSPLQLDDGQLLDVLVRALDTTGLPADRLCLEITESALMDDADAALESLLALRALGVRLAIDDFGTGQSALAYLRRFRVDQLKVDRSFVRGLGPGLGDAAIIAGIIGMAAALDLEVVAEGVETREQVQALRRLGCDHAQGYYFGPPLPSSGLDRLLANQREMPIEPGTVHSATG